jgi:ABC-2 type transport system ATP-binding protein
MMRKHTESGKTVIFSTHVLEVAEKLCDHIIIINHGKTIYHGTLEDLKKRYDNNMSLEEIFLDVTM